MSSDSRRTSRCFSWMSLNQSTSMSSSRPSRSQTPPEARAGHLAPLLAGPGRGAPPQTLPGSRTIHSATQLLLQQDPAVFQSIQLALNGVHLSIDVLLRDVLVSLDLPPNILVT